MTTQEIKSYTSDTLLYEQRIKSLCEPEIIKIMARANEELERSFQGWHLISRGGDALNYYYPAGKYIPTHDFDFGLMSMPVVNTLDQYHYNKLRDFMLDLCDRIAEQLTTHFEDNVNVDIFNDNFIKPKFEHHIHGVRLSVITFTYSIEVTEEPGNNVYMKDVDNSVLDLWIFGGVQRGVMSVKDDSRSLENVWNDYKYQKKIDYEYIRDNKLKHGLNMLYKLQDGLRGTLYFNTFNYIVKDMTSGMKYVAPGDLLTDTMRMIYFSINNDRSIKQGNNKLDKYLIKYSRLLDVVNNIDTLCRGGSCVEITASVISRDTDGYNCRGEFLGDNQSNRMNTRNSSLVELRPWFNEAYINTFNSVPNKKLCEMIEILQPV